MIIVRDNNGRFAKGFFSGQTLSERFPAEEIARDYANGESSLTLAGRFNTNPSAILKLVKIGGAKARTLSESTILSTKSGRRHIRYRSGEEHSSWKGGRCSQGNYIKVYSPNHPRAIGKYVYEHILVWEQAHNKPLPKGWMVHHLNGVTTDNRPENLFAMSKQQHSLVIPQFKKRIRELEAKVKVLELILNNQQMVRWSEN